MVVAPRPWTGDEFDGQRHLRRRLPSFTASSEKIQRDGRPLRHTDPMKFDLSKLGPREFENLAQSLAVAEIGSTLDLFGAGPDGGREATFEGPVTLGKAGPRVEGYGVLQAKYCESPATPSKDATWLIAQIRSELKEWRTSSKRTRKPDCIIFATNITLSGVPRTGGLDRVHKELKAQCEALGIREWYVWHGETINRLLENHPGIRTSYAAWILSGDVLAELYSSLSARKKEVGKGLQRYIAKELVRDLHVNLDQAGSADDLQIPLAEVFIDLPMGTPGAINTSTSTNVLRNLINACDKSASPHAPARKKRNHRRYVLVGGPGQGKSTVSQFLCQIYRAQLIEGTPIARAGDVAQAASLITSQAARENLVPNSRRWPVKVSLTQLADDLAHGGRSLYCNSSLNGLRTLQMFKSRLKTFENGSQRSRGLSFWMAWTKCRPPATGIRFLL